MNYSKKEIGEELRKELVKRYNIEKISTWACELLVFSRNNPAGELDEILERISLMDAGPEFEYTKKELFLIAEMLICEEKDLIRKIDDPEFKKRALSNELVKINVPGKILEGDNEGWYVSVQEDFENAGGYLILVSKDVDFESTDGCDYWVEKHEDLKTFFEESRWKIQWLY